MQFGSVTLAAFMCCDLNVLAKLILVLLMYAYSCVISLLALLMFTTETRRLFCRWWPSGAD